MSISTESTNAKDITADQVRPPNVANLDPSEEKRLLLARIAELDRQQTTNSPTSSASVDLVARKRRRIETSESFAKQLEQMEEWKRVAKLELENKTLRAELEHQKLLENQQPLQTKMEQYQKLLQQTIDEAAEMKQLNIKLQSDQKALLERLAASDQGINQQQKELSAKMEQYQKEQQLNVVDLKNTVGVLNDKINGKGLIPQQNRWNATACHKDLTLSKPEQLIVQYKGKKLGQRSVRAELPIPKGKFGIFYFEVKIIGAGDSVHIGLGTKLMPLDEIFGAQEGVYGYGSWGAFWGHETEGCSDWNGWPCFKEKPEFGAGDVIGCGVNLATRQIIYTKNGRRLETSRLFVDFADDLFPCVTLSDSGDKIEANFGPNFKFNIADGI
uniref:B30.2/SPRY domain-containing protein n=1 Tax=Globodera rostochiensis TaxID=31243 RepID=A0A914I6E8_GLORO